MLTKHLVESSANQATKRSSRVIMTNEGRALRELRIMHGLSMRKAGELIGVSDSYISHIENGRADAPSGVYLEKFLTVYGGIKAKSFYERARNIRDHLSPMDELVELLKHQSEEKIKIILQLVKTI